MSATGCLRCDTNNPYYEHDHRWPARPGTHYQSIDEATDDLTEEL